MRGQGGHKKREWGKAGRGERLRMRGKKVDEERKLRSWEVELVLRCAIGLVQARILVVGASFTT